MADHIHTQVAVAARDALDDSSTSWVGGEIFPYRLYPVDGAKLPYTSVWVPGEEVQRESGTDAEDKTVEAELELLVAGFFEAPAAQLEALINAHLKQVQVVLSAGVTVGGVLVSLDYRGCQKTYQGADQEYSEILMRFAGEITYLASAPDTLSWR